MRWSERVRRFPLLRRFHLLGVAGRILMLARLGACRRRPRTEG